MSLAAAQLGLTDNRQTHLRLLQCSWTLGWHVASRDCDGSARHYWGGGVTSDTTTRMLRGDWVEIEGSELCRGVPTSRLARVICGVQIRNVGKFMGIDHISDSVWQTNYNKEQDSVVFLLVRYAMAHPDVGRQRGPQHRPLCPGPLRNTHCLWKWYQRPANFSVDAGDPVRGIDINGCSVSQWRNRMLGKDKRLVLGMILFRPAILSVTPTLGRIVIDLTRSYSQLCGVSCMYNCFVQYIFNILFM